MSPKDDPSGKVQLYTKLQGATLTLTMALAIGGRGQGILLCPGGKMLLPKGKQSSWGQLLQNKSLK